MPERTVPPFRADHVGSLLRPQRLLAARAARDKGEMTPDALRAVEDECVREIVRLQEELGFKSATDGEYRRGSWHRDFLTSFENVALMPTAIKMRFHTEAGDTEHSPPGLRVVGKLARPRPIFVEHFKFLKSVARAVPKMTIPSPSNMHFRGGRAAIDERAYPDMAEFYADLAQVFSEEVSDLAAAGCRYLQIDEVNFAYLCDPTLREEVRGIGEDPAKLPHTYAKLINQAIAARPKDMTVCMHVCRGNARSAWIAEGGYDPVAEVLFNELDITGYFLEYDSPRAGGFAPLRFVPKGKTVVLGLVTTKKGKLESKDELKRRVEEASRHIPLDQLALSPQCGFSSVAEGNLISVEEEMDKLRLVVETAREIWG